MARESRSGGPRIVPVIDAGAPPEHPPGLGADSGPHPVVRAIVGLAVGAAAGAIAASVIPRPDRAARTPLVD